MAGRELYPPLNLSDREDTEYGKGNNNPQAPRGKFGNQSQQPFELEKHAPNSYLNSLFGNVPELKFPSFQFSLPERVGFRMSALGDSGTLAELPFTGSYPSSSTAFSDESSHDVHEHAANLNPVACSTVLEFASRYPNPGWIIPHKTYRPTTQSDCRRFVEDVTLEEPIMFLMEHPDGCGIPCQDALSSKFARLVGRDDVMFQQNGLSVTIRINVGIRAFIVTSCLLVCCLCVVAWLSHLEPSDPDERFPHPASASYALQAGQERSEDNTALY